MQDWRTHLANEEFHKIDPYRIIDSTDRSELISILEKIVPQRTWGDGTETFSDFIRSEDAPTEELYYAADLLKSLHELTTYRNNTEGQHDGYSGVFLDALTTAVEVLKENGIEFKGIRETYVFPSANGNYNQIDAQKLEKILNKGTTELSAKGVTVHNGLVQIDPLSDNKNPESFAKEMLWLSKYPWRRSQSLWWLFRFEKFEPNTPIWHALNILDWYQEGFLPDFKLCVEQPEMIGVGESDLGEVLLRMSQSVLEIGRSHEALRKKEVEYEAVEYRQLKDTRSAASGKASKRKRDENLECLMVEIERLSDVVGRVGDQAILDQAFKNASQKRSMPKSMSTKQDYETTLRSEAPFRSRYNAVFHKNT